MTKAIAASLLLLLVITAGCRAISPAAPKEQPDVTFRLGHVVMLVEDIDATSDFLTEVVGWQRHPLEFGVSPDEGTTGGMDLAFINANGLWLELVSPTGPGPGADLLESHGNGTILELAFESSDYDGALALMESRDIGMLNMDGSPLDESGGRIEQFLMVNGVPEPRSIRIAYWPLSLSRGTSVELYEYRPEAATDIFTLRNANPLQEEFGADVPRFDRIAIMVEDIEKSAAFYTDVLGLRRHPEVFFMDGGSNAQSGGMKVTFIDAGGVALALVQPVGDGPIMEYLEASGDGFIAELIAEVDDLGSFFDNMIARRIHMVGTDGRQLDPAIKAHVLDPFGDRIAYFPADASQGVVLEVSERGPPETSLIHARDRGWSE